MNNIPIYRAKKIDNDEYVIGYLEEHNPNDFYISLLPNKLSAYRIDDSTISIHFPNMIDSKGNKIFASLSNNGKGGDVLQKEIFSNSPSNPIKFDAIDGFTFDTIAVNKQLDKFSEYTIVRIEE